MSSRIADWLADGLVLAGGIALAGALSLVSQPLAIGFAGCELIVAGVLIGRRAAH